MKALALTVVATTAVPQRPGDPTPSAVSFEVVVAPMPVSAATEMEEATEVRRDALEEPVADWWPSVSTEELRLRTPVRDGDDEEERVGILTLSKMAGLAPFRM